MFSNDQEERTVTIRDAAVVVEAQSVEFFFSSFFSLSLSISISKENVYIWFVSRAGVVVVVTLYYYTWEIEPKAKFTFVMAASGVRVL